MTGRMDRGAGGQHDPVVVYIAGCGRSGSTLLDRMLGQVEGVAAVGELAQLWRPGELDRLICGCGEPVRRCGFWAAVAERAFGGWDSPALARGIALRPRVTRHRQLPLLLLPVRPSFRTRAREFGRLVDRTYAAIAAVSGAQVVVDSSKEAAVVYVLRPVLRDRLRLVHLVRNGAGVAYSWTKVTPKPEVDNPSARLDQYRPVRMALRWMVYNCVIELLRMGRVRLLRMRYEELVARPEEQVDRILRHGGVTAASHAHQFINDSKVLLHPTHTVAGNPMRFRQGLVTLQLDEAWRTQMPRRDRILVSLIASPLLLRFGYLRLGAPRRLVSNQ